MSVAIVCASHTPLMYKGPASNETEQRVRTAFGQLGNFVKEFSPDYIIQFAPDHFNGFFYDLMPSFCVGAGSGLPWRLGRRDRTLGRTGKDGARAHRSCAGGGL